MISIITGKEIMPLYNRRLGYLPADSRLGCTFSGSPLPYCHYQPRVYRLTLKR